MHLADLHLGYEQYGLRERAKDLSRRFREAAQKALDERVDFVVIAGDVFHSRAVDPATLMAAVEVLRPLREAGVPVLAVAGNHERGWRGDRQTWLSLLDSLGYLRNLDVGIERGLLRLGAPSGPQPSICELPSARVIGLPYLGSVLPRLLEQLAEELRQMERRYTVLLAHAGLEGEMPGFTQPLRREHLSPLEGLVDYVALGHLHKPFEHENWIYNPGSLEALGADEVQFHGGWYAVEVSGGPGCWHHEAKHTSARRRPFRRLSLDAGFYATPEELGSALIALAADNEDLRGRQALIELTLKGNLRFSPMALDLNLLSAELEERLKPLKVLLRDLATPAGVAMLEESDVPRSLIERRVLQLVIGSDSRYAPYEEQLSQIACELKEMALTGADDEPIFARALRAAADLNLAKRP